MFVWAIKSEEVFMNINTYVFNIVHSSYYSNCEEQ